MFRLMRIAAVAVLAAAIAALPIVLDRCAESCEAHQHSAAAPPTCLHAAIPGTKISSAPTVCGHDHGATAVGPAKSSTPSAGTYSIVTIDGGIDGRPPANARVGVLPHSPPNSSLSLDRRSLPLRV